MNKLEMRVGAVGIDEKSGSPVVLLNDEENKCILPIWIGLPEARAIMMAANNISSPRPLTHDLLSSTINELGYFVSEVVIDTIEANTFKASVVLNKRSMDAASEELKVDARPSDAIALALKAGAPVMVAESIVTAAAFPIRSKEEKDEQEEKQENEEFKSFVSGLKASDFKYEGKLDLPESD